MIAVNNKELTPQRLADYAQQMSPPYCYKPHTGLDSKLLNAASGRAVHIIASGPSAKHFKREQWPAEDFVIVCNAMHELHPKADVWLTCEASIGALNEQTGEPLFPWAYTAQNFEGVVIAERGFAQNSAEQLLKSYAPDFLLRWIFVHRYHWRDVFSIRNYGKSAMPANGHKSDGLWYMEWDKLAQRFNTQHTEPLGSVLLQAIHVAGIMGAARIHLWGGDFCWLKECSQHAHGGDCYAPGQRLADEIGIDVLHDGAQRMISERPSSELRSTRFFVESALSIKQIIANVLRVDSGIEFFDHTAGLLTLMGSVPNMLRNAYETTSEVVSAALSEVSTYKDDAPEMGRHDVDEV